MLNVGQNSVVVNISNMGTVYINVDENNDDIMWTCAIPTDL